MLEREELATLEIFGWRVLIPLYCGDTIRQQEILLRISYKNIRNNPRF